MRDPNEGVNGGWFPFYDRNSNGHLHGDLLPKPVKGHLNHDMEIVKRTILEHDSVFKKQVKGVVISMQAITKLYILLIMGFVSWSTMIFVVSLCNCVL